MTPRLRSNRLAMEQERLNAISTDLKNTAKKIFQFEKNANPNIYNGKEFSSELEGQKAKWTNDITVFVDEINKSIENVKLSLLGELEKPINVEIFKEKIEAELGTAREKLISEVSDQFETLFGVERENFQTKIDATVETKMQPQIKLVKDDFSAEIKILVDENNLLHANINDLKIDIENLKAAKATAEKLYHEDLEVITDRLNDLKKQFDDRVQFEESALNGSQRNDLVRQQTLISNFSNPHNPRDFRVRVPVFKGTGRPLDFLKKIKEYFDRLGLEFGDAKLHFQQALQDGAANWYSLNEDEINSWDDFETLFKDHFWSLPAQDRMKNMLEKSHYNPNEGKTRSEYAMEFFRLGLELGFTEVEVIRKLSVHFDKETRFAVRTHHINNKSDFFKLLQEYDVELPEQHKKQFFRNDNNKNDGFNNNRNFIPRNNDKNFSSNNGQNFSANQSFPTNNYNNRQNNFSNNWKDRQGPSNSNGNNFNQNRQNFSSKDDKNQNRNNFAKNGYNNNQNRFTPKNNSQNNNRDFRSDGKKSNEIQSISLQDSGSGSSDISVEKSPGN